MDIETIYEDTREIARVCSTLHPSEFGWSVGNGGVTKIQAYREAGQMAYVAFYAIYEDGELTDRCPAATMAVEYVREK